MKKNLLVLGLSLFLVGCSNAGNNDTEKSVEKQNISGEIKKAAEEQIEKFNNEQSGKSEIKLNDKQESVDLFYIKDSHKVIVQDMANDLASPINYISAVFLAEQMQQASQDFFEKTDNKLTINLVNPNDEKTPLYKVYKDKIEYVAFLDANNGSEPKEVEHAENIVTNATFIFKPTGKAKFNYTDSKLEADINVDKNKIDGDSDDVKRYKDTVRSSAITLYEANEKAYKITYPIVVYNQDELLFEVVDGKITNDNWD